MSSIGPAYRDYELLLRQLHDSDRAGKLDSDEADAIRDQMEEPWSHLTPEEQRFASRLSADLHTLSGDPPDLRVSDEERKQALLGLAPAYESRDWMHLLYLLRRCEGTTPKSIAAYMRGRCWGELGDWLAASWFFEQAAALDPANATYEFLLLDAWFKAGERDRAKKRAESILTKADSPPRSLFASAKALFDAASELPAQWAKQQYRLLVAPLKRALGVEDKLPARQRLSSVTIAAWVMLALALERSDQGEEARSTYDSAIARFPSSDELLMARALYLRRQQRLDEADRDVDSLVARSTRLPHAYLFAAHRALTSQNFHRCVELCDAGLQRATSASLKACFFEWSAISLYQLKASPVDVRLRMEDALTFQPLDQTLQRNLSVLAAVPNRQDADFSISDLPDSNLLSDELTQNLRLAPAAALP